MSEVQSEGTMEYLLMDKRREAVRQLVKAFTEVWEGSDFGPAHIVLSDYNLLNDDLDWTRRRVQEVLVQQYDTLGEHEVNELRATLLFLRAIKLVPEDWRDVHAVEDEDDE